MSTRGAARRDSGTESPDTRSPFVFLLLVLLLSVPFVVVGEATGAMLLPGLPIAALQAVCPAIAAIGLVLRRHGIRGATAFLGVNVEGAMFSVGDGHYRQGEGEACGTAVEGAMTTTVIPTSQSAKP